MQGGTHFFWRAGSAVATALLCFAGSALAQQAEFGHKTLGTLGLAAGTQPEPGFYVANKFFWYSANELVDRNGNVLHAGLDLDAVANGFGVSASLELRDISTYLDLAIALPTASVVANTERPEASLDRAGLGDLYLQPLKLGWRARQFDAVVGYAIYIPTGTNEPGGKGSVSRGHVTYELSLGGTLYFDRGKSWQVSALGSYELNFRKFNVNVTRGNTVQVQGGVAKKIFGVLDVGLAGYGLWQVSDDSGPALPTVLVGGRDVAYGLGPEIDVEIPPIRSRFTVRYEHDVTVRSRTLGQILVFALTARVFDL